MDHDVVVVGAGLGGLAAAATLSKKGFKVHLIEQHDKVGGYASNFKRKSYRMEVAIHVLDGDHKFNMRNELFDFLNVRENVDFVKLPEFYTCHFDGNKISIPDNLDHAREHLTMLFPKEKNNIATFFSTMWDIAELMHSASLRQPPITQSSLMFPVLFPLLDKYTKQSIGSYIDTLFSDNLLKVTLLANSTFYHDNPHELNILQYMSSQASYFLGGVYYVKGGSQIYSDYLAKIVTDAGGTISLNHRVEKIDLEGDKVKRVHYRKTRGDEKEFLKVASARHFIMNMPPILVYDLIDTYPDPAYSDRIKSFKCSTSATTMFFGLKRPLKDFGNDSHLNIFVDARMNMMDNTTFQQSVGIIDYDVVDTGLCKPGIYSCDLIFMDSLNNWNSLSAVEYKEKKNIVARYYTKKLCSYFPGIEDCIDLFEVGTPKTMLRYTSNTQGAAYGFSPTVSDSQERAAFFGNQSSILDRHIKNLYFGSAWSHFPGFSGAQIAGLKAAKEVLKKEGLSQSL